MLQMMKFTIEDLDERVARAVDNFMEGYGCCQSVVAAFADLYGLDKEMSLRVAAGFGGGVGRMRMMCGAVSALVILVGLDCGQTEGSDREGKSACYKVVQELLPLRVLQNITRRVLVLPRLRVRLVFLPLISRISNSFSLSL